jgi:hypothetical protein
MAVQLALGRTPSALWWAGYSLADGFPSLNVSQSEHRQMLKLQRDPMCTDQDVEVGQEMQYSSEQKQVSWCPSFGWVVESLLVTHETMK